MTSCKSKSYSRGRMLVELALKKLEPGDDRSVSRPPMTMTTLTIEPSTLAAVPTNEPPTVSVTTIGSSTIPVPSFESSSIPEPTFEPSNVPVPNFKVSTVTVPVRTSDPSTVPVTPSEPPTLPLPTCEPSTIPTPTSDPSTVQVTINEPSTLPLPTCEPSTIPQPTSDPSTVPVTINEPSTIPLPTCEPSTLPLPTSDPSIVPVTPNEHSTLPLPTCKPSTLPLPTSALSTVAEFMSEQLSTSSAPMNNLLTLPAAGQSINDDIIVIMEADIADNSMLEFQIPASDNTASDSEALSLVMDLLNEVGGHSDKSGLIETTRTEIALEDDGDVIMNDVNLGSEVVSHVSVVLDPIESHDQGNDDMGDGVTERPTRRRQKRPTTDDRRQHARDKHPLREPCHCRLSCKDKFNPQRRKNIWEQFWSQNYNIRRKFIFNNIRRKPKTRTRGDAGSSRKYTFVYTLPDSNGQYSVVCKVFFLHTIGYHHKNDGAITAIMRNTPLGSIVTPPDRRGRHRHQQIDQDTIKAHVESFHPCISHYRREHAPNRRYLPSDVTLRIMHNNFKQKHPGIKCCYSSYRKVVANMKISFTKLGEEQCETCCEYDMHKKTIHANDTVDIDCEICQSWTNHITKANKARELYRKNSENSSNAGCVVRSVDLQKVLMLPRMPGMKTAIFTKRIVAFHETFAAVGKNQNGRKPKNLSVLWHEGIAGRKAEEITSAFQAAIEHDRDYKYIVLWLDNCAGQNKCYCLFTAQVTLVNSSRIEAETITLNYFEPGHTFMSADSVHAGVEKQIKAEPGGNLFDFDDFANAISKSNGGNIEIIRMQNHNFRNWIGSQSQAKLKIPDRPLLAGIVQLQFLRGSLSMRYKLDFDDESKEFSFLKHNYKPAIPGLPRKQARGVLPCKKGEIINKLCPLMPESRRIFWKALRVDHKSLDLIDNE